MRRQLLLAFAGLATLAFIPANLPALWTTFGGSNDPRKRFGHVLVVLHSHLGDNELVLVKDGAAPASINYDWIAIPCWFILLASVLCMIGLWRKGKCREGNKRDSPEFPR